MSDERHERISVLVDEASRRRGSERDSFLDSECGEDRELRAEVEELVELHEEEEGLQPASMALDFVEQLLGLPTELGTGHPDRVGQFRILKVLGEGGMGIVYEAEQDSPKRRVALKLLRPTIGSEKALRRFEFETEILGRLQHPGIAQIFEAGMADAGSGPQPYFAMERIEGSSLTQFAGQQELDLRQRVEIFVRVCAAVDHAHQKGVIHRDLKPANILVDALGQPKILDFGIARATDSDLKTTTLQTAVGQLVGTIAYMSPEQASGASEDLDTRSDVYTLGVVYYELLAGCLPYDVSGTLIHEAAQIIREAAPIPLSSVVKACRGDLETISRKALEKEKSRRYGSAQELAADLERYLRCEPIVARPPSLGYRVRKFTSRNKALVGGAVAVILSLGIGLVASTTQFLRAEENAREAWAREQEASRQHKIAVNRADEVLRLSDARNLSQLQARASRLWPAWPDQVDKMDAWIREAEELVEGLAGHRQLLETLREEQAMAVDPEDQRYRRAWELERDRLGHADLLEVVRTQLSHAEVRMAELAKQEASVAVRRAIGELNTRQRELETQKARVEAQISEAVCWWFENSDTQWWHDTLSDLVSSLSRFAAADPQYGALANMRVRRDRAATLAQRSITAYETEWGEALFEIEEGEHYGGLTIEPQIGLVPIGSDPVSGLQEFWLLESGAEPVRDRASRGIQLSMEVGVVLVLLPGGSFWMGAQNREPEEQNYDPNASRGESPVHQVALEPYFLSKYEMTQAQWQEAMGQNPSFYHPGRKGGPHHPVEQVTWTRCQEVVRRMGLILPTEAQWEYAARAGTQSVWWCGNDPQSIATAGNVFDQRSFDREPLMHGWGAHESWEDEFAVHAPIGSFLGNAFGLHDVIGNVWEWCRDQYDSYHKGVRATDGLRLTFASEGSAERAYRGGGFGFPATQARSSYRFGTSPEYVSSHIGLRPARELDRGVPRPR